jgi:hypothetical protein
VDDGLGGTDSIAFLQWVKDEIMREFGLKDLGEVSQFLSIQFDRNMTTRELWMHQ